MKGTGIVISALLLVLSACESDSGKKNTNPTPGDPVAGQTVFAATCGTCHKDGGTGPNLAEHAPEHNDSELANVIGNGEGEMPAQNLTAEQLANVVAYLRQEFGAYNGGEGEAENEHENDATEMPADQ